MLCNMFFSYLLKHLLCLKFHTLYISTETKYLNIIHFSFVQIVCWIKFERTIIWILFGTNEKIKYY